jgi:hypothetical protein
MEIVGYAKKWGNGSGVLLPREWEGSEVKVILIDRTLQIKKEVFSMLGDCLEDIAGIYLAGSHSRGEQESGSDIDIIAVSGKTKKEIVSGRYRISIYPLESVRKSLAGNPMLIYPRLAEAKPILNAALLAELKNAGITKKSFRPFITDTKRIIRINKKLIEMAGPESKISDPPVVYSLLLRLRGIFIIKSLLGKKAGYSNRAFREWLGRELGENIGDAYQVYRDVRENRKPGIKIRAELARKLLALLEKEVKKYG